MSDPMPEAELTRLTSIVLAVRKPHPDSADRAEFAMVAKPELVHRLLIEIDRLKAAPFTLVDQLLKLLRQHHQWHLEAGGIGLPDGEGGWIEIDNGAEYSDSLMYEQTEKALAGLPPEDAGAMPRGGISAWWWTVGVLERRKRRKLDKAVDDLLTAINGLFEHPGDQEAWQDLRTAYDTHKGLLEEPTPALVAKDAQ